MGTWTNPKLIAPFQSERVDVGALPAAFGLSTGRGFVLVAFDFVTIGSSGLGQMSMDRIGGVANRFDGGPKFLFCAPQAFAPVTDFVIFQKADQLAVQACLVSVVAHSNLLWTVRAERYVAARTFTVGQQPKIDRWMLARRHAIYGKAGEFTGVEDTSTRFKEQALLGIRQLPTCPRWQCE